MRHFENNLTLTDHIKNGNMLFFIKQYAEIISA